MKKESFRLPKVAYPKNYDLFFEINLETFKFFGKEIVDVDIVKPVSKLVLNSKDLAVKSARLVSKRNIKELNVTVDNNKETVTLSWTGNVKGAVKLVLEFEGTLNDNLLGLYRSKYTHDGKTKYLATTQFESVYARYAFPCFDEPEYKSTFDVTLKVKRTLQTLSNMHIKSETMEGDKKIVKFGRTPRMSTYLLYIGVGEFEFLEDNSGRIPIRLVTTPGKKAQVGFALDLTKKFLEWFEKYSGIKYALPKLDMIALPDFASGAMENWGAITFREIYLLFDPKLTSTTVKKRIAMIIAHELWHQWSGNLVTMKWWNDLWLNESFATYMAYKAVDSLFPEWNMWEDFVRDETDRAFSDDSLRTTHPIEVKVTDPHVIEEIFDTISYSKGGSILRMLDNYLGEEIFRKGVSRYLSEYKYGNATSEDLWKSLAKVSNKPVKGVMESWIKQSGYPMVEVDLTGAYLTLKQKKFMFNNPKDSTKWKIPLVVKLGPEKYTSIIDKKEKKMRFKTSETPLVNYNQSGFYRVKYSSRMLSQLKSDISSKTMPPLNRWSVQDDLFQLSVIGGDKLDNYLDFVKSYDNESNYIVLSGIYSNLRSIYFVFSQEDFWPEIWPEFRKHFTLAFKKAMENLGWEPRQDESQSDSLLRSLAIRYLAFIEEPQVVEAGIRKFDDYINGRAELHPDLKPPVFLIAASTDNEKIYDQLEKLYLETKSPEERVVCMQALGQFKSARTIKRFLDFSVTDNVRTQDLPIAFSSVASNPFSRPILLEWLRKNWKKIERYKNSGKIFINIIESAASSYVGRKYEKQIIEFFKSHPVKYKMTVEKSLERVRRKTSLLERSKETLASYFQNKK